MFLRKVTRLLRTFKLPPSPTTNPTTPTSNTILCSQYGSQFSTLRNNRSGFPFWALIYGQAAIFMGINANIAFAQDIRVENEDGTEIKDSPYSGLQRVEDGSIIANEHTATSWVYTRKAKELHQQGKPREAEHFFLAALDEAKKGFGEREAHVAAACNNLAELYRVQKAFDKAAPLYLKAVEILEESYGPVDMRVAVAFDNLGQFYFVQQKLEEARVSYERALKIKKQILGPGHVEYANTMYHLGRVVYLQGNEKDSEALILDSLRILEEVGMEESLTYLRRLRYLSQMYCKSSRLTDAENIQRKILHIFELSKGLNSLDAANAAEDLALTMQSIGGLKEAQDLLERCLDVRKDALPEDNIQIGATMLHMARIAILNSSRLKKVDSSQANAELDKANSLIDNSIRIAKKRLVALKARGRNLMSNSKSKKAWKDEHAAFFILLQSFIALGLLEISKQESQEPREECSHLANAEKAFRQCTSTFKEARQSGTARSVCDTPEVKAEYRSCLNYLLDLMRMKERTMPEESGATLQELEDELKCIEAELKEAKQ